MEKTSYLMTPGQREKLLQELREEWNQESDGYSWERKSQRPRFAQSGIPVELFESFGVR